MEELFDYAPRARNASADIVYSGYRIRKAMSRGKLPYSQIKHAKGYGVPCIPELPQKARCELDVTKSGRS